MNLTRLSDGNGDLWTTKALGPSRKEHSTGRLPIFFFFFYVAKLYIIGLWFIEQSGGKPQLSPACYKQEILQSVVQFLYLDVFPKPPWTPDKCV